MTTIFRPFSFVSLPAWVLLVFAAHSAHAAVAVRAGISRDRITAGETLFFTIEIDSDSEQPVTPPENPDFGGLQLLGSPRTSQRISIINSVQQVSFAYSFPLTSSTPGTYVIPPVTLTVGGQTFRTESYTVQVLADSLDAFPPKLQKEAILNPRSGDDNINQQLRGRLCLVPRVSDIQPFVGEPFVVSFVLYVDPAIRAAIQDYNLVTPKSEPMLAEEVPGRQAQKSFRVEEIDGRDYNVVEYFEAVFTPTKPGEELIDGYGVRLQLVVRSSSFFSNTIPVDVMAGPVQINVRPLPDEGRPPGFQGTVGEYTLQGGVDRSSATLDDIITLKLKLSGRGSIAQAATPVLPSLADFEVFDQTEDVSKTVGREGISGEKTVEFLLRPRRAENLQIPQLDYVLFDPSTEQYRTLSLPPATIAVTQGRSVVMTQSASDSDDDTQEKEAGGLRYIKPVIDTTLRPSPPLMESFGYWTLQLSALSLVAWSFVRARRRGRMNPVALRRLHAPEAFARRFAACITSVASGKTEEAALAFDRAVREYIADLQNCSAEGLTADEIATRLAQEGLSPESTAKIGEVLVFCSSIRYAPVGSAASDLKRRMEEIGAMLQEWKPPA